MPINPVCTTPTTAGLRWIGHGHVDTIDVVASMKCAAGGSDVHSSSSTTRLLPAKPSPRQRVQRGRRKLGMVHERRVRIGIYQRRAARHRTRCHHLALAGRAAVDSYDQLKQVQRAPCLLEFGVPS